MGEYCQHLNPCHTGPRCQNGGSCRVKESIGGGTPSFACSCPVGFTASLCEIPLENACDSSPCLNGATCNLKSLHEYVCTCATGYTGKTILSSLRNFILSSSSNLKRIFSIKRLLFFFLYYDTIYRDGNISSLLVLEKTFSRINPTYLPISDQG